MCFDQKMKKGLHLILLYKRNIVQFDIIFRLVNHKIIQCQHSFIIMLSKNNVYAYQEREEEFFERQLPYRALKIPFKQPNQKMLKSNQKRQQVQRLRQQILKKCKFDELQYIQIMKQQRQEMAYRIRQNKRLINNKKMEQLHGSNNKMYNKKYEQFQDSLDQFRKENNNNKAKSKRGQQMQLTILYDQQSVKKYKKMNLIQRELIKASNNKQQKEKFENQQYIIKQLNKEERIKKIKRQMLSKYKFYGQNGIKELKSNQWWLNKVRQIQEKQSLQNTSREKQSQNNMYQDHKSINSQTDKRELKTSQIRNNTQFQWWAHKIRQYQEKQARQNKSINQQSQNNTDQDYSNSKSNIDSKKQSSEDQHLDH